MNGLSEKTGKCPICGSQDINISADNKDQFSDNFYLEALRQDLGFAERELKEDMVVYECAECATLFCDPWMNYQTSAHMFNVIYGQHNRGWDALYAWLRRESIQDYSRLLAQLENRTGRVQSYAELNCPFQGNLLRLRSQEMAESVDRRELFDAAREYLTSRQQDESLAGCPKLKPEILARRSRQAQSRLKEAQRKINPGKTRRYLIYEATSLCWSFGCNAQGVNCKPLADVLLDVGVLSIDEAVRQNLKLDLVGVFNTLDHLIDPMATLEKLLSVARCVVVVNHAQAVISKQHHFVLRPGFVDFLEARGYVVDDVSAEAEIETTELKHEKLVLLITT